MGSFTQKHVLIQTDQSESRDCVWAQSDWPIRKKVMLTNPNFLIISPCKGIKGELYLWYVSLSVVSVNRGWIESRVKGQWLQLWRVSGQWLHLWLQLQRVSGHTCGYNLFSAGLSTSVLVSFWYWLQGGISKMTMKVRNQYGFQRAQIYRTKFLNWNIWNLQVLTFIKKVLRCNIGEWW